MPFKSVDIKPYTEAPGQIIEALPSVLAGVGIFLVFVHLVGMRRVPKGMEYTVIRLGRYSRTLKPGIHFIFWGLDEIGIKVNMVAEQTIEIPQREVITRDKAMLSLDGFITFQIINAAKSENIERSIFNLIGSNIRNIISSMDLKELLSKKDKVNSRLLVLMNYVGTVIGIKVANVEINYIDPPSNLADAMERQRLNKQEKSNFQNLINKMLGFFKGNPEVDKQPIKYPQEPPKRSSGYKNPCEEAFNGRSSPENGSSRNKVTPILKPISKQLIRDTRRYMSKENFNLTDFKAYSLYPKLEPYLDIELSCRMSHVGLGGRTSNAMEVEVKAGILDNLARLENNEEAI